MRLSIYIMPRGTASYTHKLAYGLNQHAVEVCRKIEQHGAVANAVA